jgi:ArsR family transcriptional regulator
MEKPLVYINTHLYIGRMLNTTVELDRLSDRLKALSDSTRLRILSQLACGECCQCEINDELGASQPLLAFHLKVLREAGLIRSQRRGRWVFYSVCREPIAELGAFLKELTTATSLSGCCGGPNQAEAKPAD